jgi:peptidyl-prolyl cis-trans isomerase C
MRSVLKITVTAIIGAWLLCPLTLSAADAPAVEKQEVAKVNGSAVYKKDFDMAYGMVEEGMKSRGAKINDSELKALKEKVLDNLIDAEIIYQASQKDKVKIDEEKLTSQWSKIKSRMESDPNYKANIEKMKYSEPELKEQIRRQMIIQKFLTDKFMDKASVTPDEIKAYYDGNQKAFHIPEQVQASHILIKVEPQADEKTKEAALKKIKEIQEKIKKGGDFAALAKEFSGCPSKEKGGDLGFFGRGQMVKPFEDAAFSLEEGKISDIVTTNFGYHLIKVTGKKAESNIPFDEVKPKIENFLKQQKVQKEIAGFLASEKKSAKVERLLQ